MYEIENLSLLMKAERSDLAESSNLRYTSTVFGLELGGNAVRQGKVWDGMGWDGFNREKEC